MEFALLLALSALTGEQSQPLKPVAKIARVVMQGRVSTQSDRPPDKLRNYVFDLKLTCPLPESPSIKPLINQAELVHENGIFGSVKPPTFMLYLGDLELDDDARRELATKAYGRVARIEGDLMLFSKFGGSGSDWGPWMAIRVTKFTILD